MTARVRAGGLLLAVALAVSMIGVASPARADVSAQGCSAHAVVVVEPGPGPVAICFDGAISGLDALQLAGANPITYGFAGQGAAVCQLYGVGNPADSSCLIGHGGQYWAYYRAGPGAGGWTYSRAGANTTSVTDGSVEGWRYGTGGAPGFVSYCSIVGCGPPPTEAPPPTAPPATVAPPATAAPATGAPSAAAAPNSGTKADPKDTKGDSPSPAGAAATSGGERVTSTTAKHGRTTASRSDHEQQSGSAQLAAGGGGDGGDGGSPIGVIVAVAAVVAAVGGGLWLRKRRRGPAPG